MTQIYSTIPVIAQETNASLISSIGTHQPVASDRLLVNSTGGFLGGAKELRLENMTVNYHDNSSGYLVFPLSHNISSTREPIPYAPYFSQSNASKLPAVVMIHENRGLNEHIRLMADTLANEGYVVLAVDLFDANVASTREEARGHYLEK